MATSCERRPRQQQQQQSNAAVVVAWQESEIETLRRERARNPRRRACLVMTRNQGACTGREGTP